MHARVHVRRVGLFVRRYQTYTPWMNLPTGRPFWAACMHSLTDCTVDLISLLNDAIPSKLLFSGRCRRRREHVGEVVGVVGEESTGERRSPSPLWGPTREAAF